MLREHINDIMTRWNPKERRGSKYDPGRFLETPEQARKLIKHLQLELAKARSAKNKELIAETEEVLAIVESLSRRFFRWEQSVSQEVNSEDMREIKKLPMLF